MTAGADGARVGLVADLWRFPVKSFGGERVRRAFVGPFGMLGDRRQAVVGEDGAALSARRVSGLLAFRARYVEGESAAGVRVTTPSGEERDWGDPRLEAEVAARLGRPVSLATGAAGIHDCAPLHLLSTASLAAMSEWIDGEEADRRRFRANIVIEPERERPFAEGEWVGRRLAVGGDGPVLAVVSPTERCVITTFDPDTLEREPRILARLARDRENLLGVYAQVARPGWIATGDAVRLVEGA